MIKLNLFTKQKQTHRLKKTNLQLLVGDVWEEGMVRESGMDMHTLLYLKWITNKHLLYSTGNSAQCYAWKREWIHGCLWLSPFCCPPKNYHNIVNQLYFIQKKKLFKKKIKILEEISPLWGASLVAQRSKRLPAMRETWIPRPLLVWLAVELQFFSGIWLEKRGYHLNIFCLARMPLSWPFG